MQFSVYKPNINHFDILMIHLNLFHRLYMESKSNLKSILIIWPPYRAINTFKSIDSKLNDSSHILICEWKLRFN